MTFLKKLGQIIATGIELLTGLGPILSASLPSVAGPLQVVSKDLMAVANVVIQVEAIGASLGLVGADKLRAATGPVVQILMQSELLLGKPITDAAALNTAAQSMINAVVAMLNAIHPSAATATSVVTANPPSA